jgi:hypothetical protein
MDSDGLASAGGASALAGGAFTASATGGGAAAGAGSDFLQPGETLSREADKSKVGPNLDNMGGLGAGDG